MKNNNYSRLNNYEREMISRGLVGGLKIREIALNLSRSPSTISREIRRNISRYPWYCADCAQSLAESRAKLRKKDKRKILLNKELEKYIHEKLALFWSPEQIANRNKTQVSHRHISGKKNQIYPAGTC